jgi:hypothetical protein
MFFKQYAQLIDTRLEVLYQRGCTVSRCINQGPVRTSRADRDCTKKPGSQYYLSDDGKISKEASTTSRILEK